MKISFCTTCMGRRQHLEQTLLKNIEDNLPAKPGDPSVEFVLVDYNSKDGLKDWIENNPALKPYLEDGTLVYARHPDATHFHHAHAKNMAHRLATGDVVCNVDADNFTGKGFARYLAKEFAGGKSAIVHPAFSTFIGLPPDAHGYYGRIALLRKDFVALGGYSETRFKKGWGDEDRDLILRALAYRLEPRPMFEQAFFGVIPHSNEERVKNTAGGITEQEVENVNSGRKTFQQLRNTFGTYVSSVQVNRDGRFGHFGKGTVLGIDNEKRVIGPVKPFARISRRTVHAHRALKRDYAIQAPAQTISG